MPLLDLDAPQLGEHVWHAFTDDRTIGPMSEAHRKRIEDVVARHLPDLDWQRARLLEVGAYRHYTGHLLAAAHGCEFVVTDIAAASLRDGEAQARAAGVQADVVRVVADFHDFPFADGAFDVVFVASSVHHTRRPEQVLREMMRVLRPGGVLILENEPCARTLCFHAFQVNRQESFTPYEASMHARGLLPTIASPFWGARAEALFGMVENDRIPLSLYTEVFDDMGAVLERRLSTDSLVGEVERQLLALSGNGRALRSSVRALLADVVRRAGEDHGETERLLGYTLPSVCAIHELAGNVTNLLERRPRGKPDEEWDAEMFGAAITAVVRRTGGPSRAASLFRREMATESDGVLRERGEGASIAGRLGAELMPDLHAVTDHATVRQWFAPEEWHFVREEHGAHSMINVGSRSRVRVPTSDARSLLLIRYYAVAGATPYRVCVWAGGRLVDDQLIMLSETRLVRAYVPAGSGEITIAMTALDDSPAEGSIHMGVFQLFAERQ